MDAQIDMKDQNKNISRWIVFFRRKEEMIFLADKK